MSDSVNPCTSQAYVQVAYVVPDIAEAAGLWAAGRGAGPFFLMPDTAQTACYRGREMAVDCHLAFGQFGSMMVELIQPRGREPSVYRDLPGGATQGLHHFAQICNDLDAAVDRAERMGFELVCRAGSRQSPVAFMDARHELGHMIELCQDNLSLRRLYAFIAEAACGWRGENPVRQFPSS